MREEVLPPPITPGSNSQGERPQGTLASESQGKVIPGKAEEDSNSSESQKDS